MSRRISVVIDSRGVNQAVSQLTRLDRIGDRAVGTLNRIVSGFKKLGSWIWRYRYRLTAAATALVYFAGRTYMAFEDTMVRTKVALRTTAEDLELLEQKALEIGSTTVYSATEAAEGMKILGRAGMNTEQILASITPVLDLANVAEIQLGEAAEKTAHVLQMWNMEATESRRIADVLAMSEQVATGSILETAEALKFAGIGAAKANISFEETAAMILELAKGGILGSMAGRALRMSFIRFERIKTGQVTKLAADTFKRLGGGVQEAVKQVQAGNMEFVEFVSVLTKAGATLGDMANIFESQAAPAMLTLGQATGESYQKVVDILMNSAGYSAEAAAEIADTLDGTVKRIKNTLGVMAIELTSTVAPSLKSWLDETLHPWIKDVTEAWKTGGDTWSEKLRTVWEQKLLPTFRTGLEGIVDAIKNYAPTIAEAMGGLAVDMAGAFFEGFVKKFNMGLGIGSRPGATSAEGFREEVWKTLSNIRASDVNSLLDYISKHDVTSMSQLPSHYRSMAETIASASPGASLADVSLAPALIDSIRGLITTTEENTEATRNSTLTTEENIRALTGGGTETSPWLSEPVGSMVSSSASWLGGTLLSYVTDPITQSLDKHLGPTSTRIGQLTDIGMRIFDVPLGGLNASLDTLISLMGGPSYSEGRLTGEGAYAYAGAPAGGGFSASSALRVDQMNFNGVAGGEDAGHRATHAIAEYQALSSRQLARSIKRGMVRSEAQER